MTERAISPVKRALLWAILITAAVAAQEAGETTRIHPYSIPPDYAKVSYGPHQRNVMDVWKAKSERPTPVVIHIHGGAFVVGDKSTVSPGLLRYCLDHGVSVATINYRYSTQAPYPAPMEDGALAVQFLRSKAKEWNFDPRSFAATGASAGAGISLWLGFHDDMADPGSTDPARRQSTRLSAIGPVDGQSTYDPREVARLIDERTGNIGALKTLYGLKSGEKPDERILRLYADASAVTHLSAGDPPVFMYYTRPMRPLPPSDMAEGIHNPRFGFFLKERMYRLG
jgi:acetyl esterase